MKASKILRDAAKYYHVCCDKDLPEAALIGETDQWMNMDLAVSQAEKHHKLMEDQFIHLKSNLSLDQQEVDEFLNDNILRTRNIYMLLLAHLLEDEGK